MKAVILASGRGSRMMPLTEETPKPLLKYQNKTLIQWKLDSLPEEIKEIIIVIGYLGEKIKKYFSESWKGKKITYIEQTDLNGTAGALKLCENLLDNKTLVLNGDDIYQKEDLEKLCLEENAILVSDMGTDGFKKIGQIIKKPDDTFHKINMIKGNNVSSLINTGAYVLSKDYFKFKPEKVTEKEYGIPQTLIKVSEQLPVKIILANEWKQITVPEDLD